MNDNTLGALRETVAISHRLLYLTGLGTTRGHTSARIPDTDTFIIKPWPHIQMHRVRAEDLIVMDLDGNIVGAGDRKITKVRRVADTRRDIPHASGRRLHHPHPPEVGDDDGPGGRDHPAAPRPRARDRRRPRAGNVRRGQGADTQRGAGQGSLRADAGR